VERFYSTLVCFPLLGAYHLGHQYGRHISIKETCIVRFRSEPTFIGDGYEVGLNPFEVVKVSDGLHVGLFGSTCGYKDKNIRELIHATTSSSEVPGA
jgi:hypothetical protein